MPYCSNCDAFVTERYVRVFSVDGETVRACPWCPDKIRRGSQADDTRATRGPRYTGGE